MKKGYVDIPQGQVHYILSGKGDPLLLLHASPLNSDAFIDLISILDKYYKIIAMDTMGFGKSDDIPREYSIEDYAQTVIDFLNALHTRKTNIVGHATGSLIALEVAARHPELIDRLVLGNCPFYTQEEREERLNDISTFPCKPFEIKEDGSHITEMWESRRKVFPKLSLITCHKSVIMNLLAGTKANMPMTLLSYNMQQKMPLIKNPTLLVYGTEDIFYTKRKVTQSLIPDSKVEIVKGGDFYLIMEKTEEFGDAVLNFLNPAESGI